MIVDHDLEDILKKVKDGLATPYIRPMDTLTSLKLEIGYCILNRNHDIKRKVPINNIGRNDFVIIADKLLNIDINFDSSTDGYIRFWVTNINYYLKWGYDSEEDCYTLTTERK